MKKLMAVVLTLRFTINDKLVLNGTDGAPATYYFSLNAPTVSLIES